jgi:hypothetical protein
MFESIVQFKRPGNENRILKPKSDEVSGSKGGKCKFHDV